MYLDKNRFLETFTRSSISYSKLGQDGCPLLFIGHSNEIREDDDDVRSRQLERRESGTRIMINRATYSGHRIRRGGGSWIIGWFEFRVKIDP